MELEGIPSFEMKNIPVLMHLLRPIIHSPFTQKSFYHGGWMLVVVHNVGLYHCSRAQHRPHKPTQTDRWDRFYYQTADAGGKKCSPDEKSHMKNCYEIQWKEFLLAWKK